MTERSRKSGWRHRSRWALCLLMAVSLGVLNQSLREPDSPWWIHRAAGALYVMAGAFFVLLLKPGLRPFRVCGAVLAATCAVEFLQLWKPPLLQEWRATTIGNALLGSTFSGQDFPNYLVGAGLAWGIAVAVRWRVRRLESKHR